MDNILQFYHETYISYILDDFRQYCPRIEDNIVYFGARQYCPLSKWTYFLGSTDWAAQFKMPKRDVISLSDNGIAS